MDRNSRLVQQKTTTGKRGGVEPEQGIGKSHTTSIGRVPAVQSPRCRTSISRRTSARKARGHTGCSSGRQAVRSSPSVRDLPPCMVVPFTKTIRQASWIELTVVNVVGYSFISSSTMRLIALACQAESLVFRDLRATRL